MDERIQVHQLRQFLQTSSLVDQEGLVALLQHFLAKTAKSDSIRDKIDFLLVQYFSQLAPTEPDDDEVDLAYVAQALEPILGPGRAEDSGLAERSRSRARFGAPLPSLDELLHGGVLEQGRKAKIQAGDLVLPAGRAGGLYSLRIPDAAVFFRLMLGDLNHILDGLNELEEKGIETIDCRRAQFSAQEPIMRLRMICQSWKVMFQAEYSSGQPLRMLVDLRASVEHALGRGQASGGRRRRAAATAAAPSEARGTTAAAGAKAAACGRRDSISSGEAALQRSNRKVSLRLRPMRRSGVRSFRGDARMGSGFRLAAGTKK